MVSLYGLIVITILSVNTLFCALQNLSKDQDYPSLFCESDHVLEIVLAYEGSWSQLKYRCMRKTVMIQLHCVIVWERKIIIRHQHKEL